MENVAATPGTFPFTAWEQAVFVVLFIIFVTSLLKWFSKQQKEWQEFIDVQNTRWQDAIKYQRDQWGNTIREQNTQWQSFLEGQSKRDCDNMDKVTLALNALTLKIAEHDERSANRFLEALEIAKTVASRPIRRKSTGNSD